MRNRLTRAFTLVEIILTIAVLAVLLAVLLPALNKARLQAREAVCLHNLRQVYLAEMAYATDHGVLAYDGTWHDSPDFAEKGHLYSQIWGRAIEPMLGIESNSGPSLRNVDTSPDVSRRNSPLYCSGTPYPARKAGPFGGSSYPRVLNQWVYDSAKPGKGNRIHRGQVSLLSITGSDSPTLSPADVVFHFEGKGYWEIDGITGTSAAYPVLPADAQGSWHDLNTTLLYWDGHTDSRQTPLPTDPTRTKAWGPPGLTRDDLLLKRGF